MSLLQGIPPLPIRIKWPNDIYYVPPGTPQAPVLPPPSVPLPDGTAPMSVPLKLGGCLIHTSWMSDRFNVVVGIGLNVSNRQPTTCIEEILHAAIQSQSQQGANSVASQLQGLHVSDSAQPGSSSSSSASGLQLPAVPRELVLARVMSHLEECFAVGVRRSGP